jgi:hypothetical protein
MAAALNPHFDLSVMAISGAGYVRCVTGINHTNVYKFYMKYCLYVNNYKHGDDADLQGYVREI